MYEFTRIIKYSANFILCLSLPLAAHAAVNVKPQIYWEFGGQSYLSPEAAYSAYVALLASRPKCSGPELPVYTVPEGLQAMPSAPTINGAPAKYNFHATQYWCATDDVYGMAGIVDVQIQANYFCPQGSQIDVNTGPRPSDQHFICKFPVNVINRSHGSCPVGNPVYPASGLKVQVEVDYQSPNGLLDFVRTYRSDLGGFASAATVRGLVDNRSALAQGGCLMAPRISGSHQSSACFSIMGTGAATAELWAESGQIIQYDLGGANQATPAANTGDRLIKAVNAQGEAAWRASRLNNTMEIYSDTGALLSQTDVDGKAVKYSYSDANTLSNVAPRAGLILNKTDPWGRTISFQYDKWGKLVQMTDPNGQAITYAYGIDAFDCGSENCEQVRYPDQFIRQYIYNESAHIGSYAGAVKLMTGIREVSGTQAVRVGTYTYGPSGQANSTERASGLDKYSFSRTTNAQNGSVTTTDPLQTARKTTFKWLFGDIYPTVNEQPGGAGCGASISELTYDSNGNKSGQDDFNGHRTCFSHDLNRNLEGTRVEGLAKTTDCATVTGNTVLPTGSRKISTAWHPDWAIKTKQAEPNKLTTWVYNGQPDPFNGNQLLFCVTPDYGATFPDNRPKLPDGKDIVVLCKEVVQATKDARGAQGLNPTLDNVDPNAAWQSTTS